MCRPFVITSAEVLLQPDVEADKKITAPHLFDFQLRGSGSPVAPGDGERRPTEAASGRASGICVVAQSPSALVVRPSGRVEEGGRDSPAALFLCVLDL